MGHCPTTVVYRETVKMPYQLTRLDRSLIAGAQIPIFKMRRRMTLGEIVDNLSNG